VNEQGEPKVPSLREEAVNEQREPKVPSLREEAVNEQREPKVPSVTSFLRLQVAVRRNKAREDVRQLQNSPSPRGKREEGCGEGNWKH
jgi:hypothetical protein